MGEAIDTEVRRNETFKVISLRILCTNAIVRNLDALETLSETSFPLYLRENVNSFVQKTSIISNLLSNISREHVFLLSQISHMRDYPENVFEKLSSEIPKLKLELSCYEAQHNIIKMKGIPCFVGGQEWLLSLKRNCTSTMFKIYKLKAELIEDVGNLDVQVFSPNTRTHTRIKVKNLSNNGQLQYVKTFYDGLLAQYYKKYTETQN